MTAARAAISTTQIYAAAINERRRATMLATDFRPRATPRESTRSA